MAGKKISELSALGAAFAATDLFEVSDAAGGGSYTSKSITGANLAAGVYATDAGTPLNIRSGGATTLAKISIGTNANKATIGVAGAADTFFTSTAQDDLVIRADDNNNKVHIGAGTSGIAGLVVTEVSNVGKVGIGTHVPGVPLEVLDSTASSATQGGNLRLSANDGATMASGHRLGVIEFAGAEDAGGSITVGARIEALTDATWSASENGADMVFYTTDGNASQSEQMRITASTGVSIPNRKLTKSGSTDGAYNGDVVYFGTGSSVVGKIYHYKSDGSWELADANTVANCDGLLAVALGTDPDVDGMLVRGMVTLIDIQGTEAVGDVLYLSESATGAADCAAPAGSGDVVRIIGYCLSTDDEIWFNPDNTWVELS